MADRDSAPPGNGTFWNSITAAFEFFRSREAESSSATAATTRTNPRPEVSPPTVGSDRPRPSGAGIAAAERQGPAALEAYLERQWADYIDRTQSRSASSVREGAEFISRQNERRMQMERRIPNEERIRSNDERFSNSIADYERDVQAESPPATAATTRASPRPRFPPPTVESERASPPGIYDAMRQGHDALEAFLARQVPNYRYGARQRLASSVRESADYISRLNERRIRLERRIQNYERIQNELRERIQNYERIQNELRERIQSVERILFNDARSFNSIADYERDIQSGSPLAAEPPDATVNAAKYLSELQPVALKDLAEDGRICAICRETYNTDEDPEHACKVGHCGHVLGRTCLSKWVMPTGSRPNNTCPLCRAVIFEADPPDLSDAFDFDNIDRVFPVDATTTGQDFNDEDWLDEDEELPSDLPTVEDEEPHGAERMVNGRYASGRFDPAIVDVMSSTQGREAWEYMRTQRLERARAGIAQPSYMLSEYVLAYFRIFVRESNVGSSATISASLSVSRITGQLYVRLREDMERTAMPIVWTEYGLPLSLLLNPATIPLIESTLERLVDIELQRYAADY